MTRCEAIANIIETFESDEFNRSGEFHCPDATKQAEECLYALGVLDLEVSEAKCRMAVEQVRKELELLEKSIEWEEWK